MTRLPQIVPLFGKPDTVSFEQAWNTISSYILQKRGIDLNGEHDLQIAIKPCPIHGTNMNGMAICVAPKGITDRDQFCRSVVVAYFGERPLKSQNESILGDARSGIWQSPSASQN